MTMKPDTIVSWPKNNDYPLWREMIRGNRHRLGKVIVVFTETNDGVDFSPFVREAMHLDGVDFYSQPEVRERDWRDVAVNEALLHSTSDWVWFTEQDFFIKNGFWEDVGKAQTNVLAVYQEKRMHPCCIFIRRDTLNKTKRNFGIVPGISDHFSKIQTDLERMSEPVWHIKATTYSHLNGLSHNFNLLRHGVAPNYEPQVFKKYLSVCLTCEVPLDPEWEAIAKSITSITIPGLGNV